MISLDPLKPYATMIKWIAACVLVIALLGTGAGVGCSVKENRMEAQVLKVEKERDGYRTQAETSAAALVAVNDQTAANKKAAEDNAKAAEAATKAAEKAKADLAKRESAWQKEYAKLKKQPDCATILEQNLCPALRDY